MIYEFTFKIKPESHADATMFNSKTGHAFTPDTKKQYQAKCIANFKAKARYTYPIEGPLVAFWVFYMSRGNKMSKDRLRGPVDENLFHTLKPDYDGLVKVMQDLIQEGKISHKSMGWRSPVRLGLIKNDSQITLGCIEKIFVKKDQDPMTKLILWKPNKKPPLMRYVVKALLTSERSSE